MSLSFAKISMISVLIVRTCIAGLDGVMCCVSNALTGGVELLINQEIFICNAFGVVVKL